MNIKPLSDLIVIERANPETELSWGFIFPPIAQEKPDMGTIVAIGPGKYVSRGTCRYCGKSHDDVVLPMETKVGDKVLYTKYANLPFKYGDKEYVTMHEADIIGIVE